MLAVTPRPRLRAPLHFLAVTRRTHGLVLTLAGPLALAGVLGGCGSSDKAASGPTTTAGPVDVEVLAHDIGFDKATYSATQGDVSFRYVNNGAIAHTLLIEDVNGFKLTVNKHGDTEQGSVTLTPGTYTVYCDIPGHRAAGMHAELDITG